MNLKLFYCFVADDCLFFTWSENVIITSGIKVVERMGLMIAPILMYKQILQFGAVNNLKFKNIFSPLFYLLYFSIGIHHSDLFFRK